VIDGVGPLSLREAVEAANSTTRYDVIRFAPSLSGRTIQLQLGDLPITRSVFIQGLGANRLTIDADGDSRIFTIANEGPVGAVRISGLTLTGGEEDDGGAISFEMTAAVDSLLVQGCVFTDNEAVDDGLGGAIYTENDAEGPVGGLVVQGCVFRDNFADEEGGAIWSEAARIVVQDSTFVGNGVGYFGGAIATCTCEDSLVDSFVVQRCVFRDNYSFEDAGAVGSGANRVVLQDCTFADNSASFFGGAVMILGCPNFSILRSTFARNTALDEEGIGGGAGGAAWIGFDSVGRIIASTFYGNVAGAGGGALGVGFGDTNAVTVVNSTISGNTAGDPNAVEPDSEAVGGGILMLSGRLTLLNVTVTQNRALYAPGGGLACFGGTVNLFNTIVADNRGAGEDPEADLVLDDLFRVNGTVNAQFSLIRAANGAVNGVNVGNIYNVSPNLGPLQNNGGPTLTHLPLAGSRAINAGNNLLAVGLFVDQRGRPRLAGLRVDIGAVEVGGLSHRYNP
ncbi:MAG: choice-of-anchor Q domain-containing protein, partial [Gemmataceae bacterium]